MRYNAGEIITAMITPFKEDLSVDYVALEKLVNHLIDNGTDAILVAGTTGETPTLSHEEEREIFLFVKKVLFFFLFTFIHCFIVYVKKTIWLFCFRNKSRF